MEIDLGEDGTVLDFQIDKEVGAGGSTDITVLTRSDEGCAWDERGSTTVDEDASSAEVQANVARYVQIEQTVTGASVEQGTVGTGADEPDAG